MLVVCMSAAQISLRFHWEFEPQPLIFMFLTPNSEKRLTNVCEIKENQE